MPKTIYIISILICTLSLSEARAQRKAVGSTFSYAGVSLTYEHGIGDDSFIDINLRMETSSMFLDRRNTLGMSASFTWNMIFAETESSDGNKVIFFAGPGAMLGYSGDLRRGNGVIIGMKGRVGGECTFKRKVTISLSVAPVLGLHLSTENGMRNMLLYKTGLLYGIMPEVGIKYAF